MTEDNQSGDDAGTHAGKPDAQKRKNLQHCGAGGGIGAGQEPLEDHGGDQGKPKTISDQR